MAGLWSPPTSAPTYRAGHLPAICAGRYWSSLVFYPLFATFSGQHWQAMRRGNSISKQNPHFADGQSTGFPGSPGTSVAQGGQGCRHHFCVRAGGPLHFSIAGLVPADLAATFDPQVACPATETTLCTASRTKGTVPLLPTILRGLLITGCCAACK